MGSGLEQGHRLEEEIIRNHPKYISSSSGREVNNCLIRTDRSHHEWLFIFTLRAPECPWADTGIQEPRVRVLSGRGGWGPRTSGLRSRPTLGWRPKIIVYLRAVGVGAPSGVFDCRFALAKLGACGPLAQSELCFSFKGRNSRHFLVTSVGAFVVLAGFKEPVSSCESQARSLQPRAHLVFFSFFEGSGAIQLAGRIPWVSLAAG